MARTADDHGRRLMFGDAAAGARRTVAGSLRLAAGVAAMLFALAMPVAAEPVKGEATFTAANGFARLVLHMSGDVETDVSVAGTILVVNFNKPIDIPIDALGTAVPDYVSAARRDPDGSAIRLALNRKVKVNTMTAGERVFIDLLPESWSGLPPGLPQEVVRELAERARAAERALKQQQLIKEVQKRPPVRVRISVQPTFARFTFELPARIAVSTSLNEGNYAVVFDNALTFDLGEARNAAPSQISAIEQKLDSASSMVSFKLVGEVDVRSFREENNFVVDVSLDRLSKESNLPGGAKNVQIVRTAQAKKAEKADKAERAEVAPAAAPALPPAQRTVAGRPAVEPPPTVAAGSAASKAAQPSPPVNGSPTLRSQVSVDSLGGELRVNFPYSASIPAAAFRQGDVLWLVFNSRQAVDTEIIQREAGSMVGQVSQSPLANAEGVAIRLRLSRPQLAMLAADRDGWFLKLADSGIAPAQPLSVARHLVDPRRANVKVLLPSPGPQFSISDPDTGDALTVVTAMPPARGLVKRQDFVEFSLLESIHGVVVRALADDVAVVNEADGVAINRPGGLTISSADAGPDRATSAVPLMFDPQEWLRVRSKPFLAQLDHLVDAAARASENQRLAAQLELARFYIAWQMFFEAKGVLDLALSDVKLGQESPAALTLRAVANILAKRPEEGLRDLTNPVVGNTSEFELWKALAFADQDRWVEAREKFKNAEFALTALPVELQRIALAKAMQAALEVRDYAGASARSNDLDSIGIPRELLPSVTLMRGQLAQAWSRDEDALRDYRMVTASPDRGSAAKARLLEIALLEKRDGVNINDYLNELETMSVTWRGDPTEVHTLSFLSRIYQREARYREVLVAARNATKLAPYSEISREMQDRAAALFAELFRGQKADELPPVEALALFYEFQDLTPIGRRGDEIIRKLAERLVGVDLLDQSAALLQYQVDHRLEGAARAQVAARLAMVYLMARKPERSVSVLRTTRIADLAGELRQQRLLLEARAQSDLGRHDLAIDLVSNIPGPEAIRLRSDIYWAARRWRESAEQIELLYGERWKDFKPLTDNEKSDILRAAIGYALSEDAIGIGRFREKYAPKMTEVEDRIAFDIAAKPSSGSAAAFSQIAKMAASIDTLDGFLRDIRARFPDGTAARAPLPPDPAPTGALPSIPNLRPVAVQGNAGEAAGSPSGL